MKTIHKYPLVAYLERQEIQMPARAEILCVQVQGGDITLWAEVDSGEAMVTRVIHFVGTGLEVPECTLKYIGTVQLLLGQLVIHVFEEVN